MEGESVGWGECTDRRSHAAPARLDGFSGCLLPGTKRRGEVGREGGIEKQETK